jgi:hypothetical protein
MWLAGMKNGAAILENCQFLRILNMESAIVPH